MNGSKRRRSRFLSGIAERLRSRDLGARIRATMPRFSSTGNARKLCGCGRSKWSGCPHPWYVDYTAPPTHPARSGQRFRRNLDQLIQFHPTNIAEAKAEAHRAIDAWLHGRDPAELQPTDRPTLARVLEAYRQRPGASAAEVGQGRVIARTVVNGRRFGDWRVIEITREAIEAYRRQRPRVAANRDLALLRAMFNWAVLAELVPATPFKVGTVAAVKLSREDPRTRRLQPGEEERLMVAARGLLPHLITAALETGCRLGELLSLQWEQVRGDLFLPAGKTKAKKPRRVPISSVLRAVVDARRNDPSGSALPPSGYVFGDEVGRRRRSIRGTWVATCKRAGISDLNFHDLRREAGSRWMDAGVPLATIQRWLGHHNISQTSVYLGASLGGDELDMERFEQRMGRVQPLTQNDLSGDPNGIERTRSDQNTAETTTTDPIGPVPTDVVH